MTERALVRLAGPGAAMKNALRQAALPIDDLGAEARVYELRDDGGALGWAALERFGGDALLRSVVIAPHRRGEGVGADLVGKIGAEAKQSGISRLWLLTETAEPFFARIGFARAVRDGAPSAIRETSEFSTVCPASAVCMSKALA